MPRRPRFIVAGQPHHVVQRGHNRAPVFFCEEDRLFYKECLLAAAKKYGCTIHAYCLMTNHIHLLVTPPAAGALSAMMQLVGRLYVRHVNQAQMRSGTLWEDRFKVSAVDADDYLVACMRYIEMNPVRARLVRTAGRYPWSSHAANAQGGADALVTPHPLYKTLAATPAGRAAAYRRLFEKERPGDLALIRQSIQGNWVLGNDNFRQKMARKTGREDAGPRPRGGDRRSRKFKKRPRRRAA